MMSANNSFKSGSLAAIAVILATVFLINDSYFLVDQRKQAIVLQFGQFVRAITQPGLHFKIPLIQEIQFYDSRVMEYSLPPVSVTMEDQKRLVVDTYTRYRIADPLGLYRAIKPATEMELRKRLNVIITSSVQNVLGRVPLIKTLSPERAEIMHQIVTEVKQYTAQLGVEIIDIRIVRTELPEANREAVFARMNAELNRYAKENLGRGREKAQQIRANADKEKTILLANAEKQSKILKGEGEAQALEIRMKAYHADENFYERYRYYLLNEEAFSDHTQFVIGTDGHLGHMLGEGASKITGKSKE